MGGRGCILSLTQLHFSLLVFYTSASDCHSSSGLLRNRNQMDKYLSFPPDPPPSFGSPPYLLTFVNCTFRPAQLPDLLSSLIFIICYAILHFTDRYRHFSIFFSTLLPFYHGHGVPLSVAYMCYLCVVNITCTNNIPTHIQTIINFLMRCYLIL